jgi:hypothetical protein
LLPSESDSDLLVATRMRGGTGEDEGGEEGSESEKEEL